jgi:4-amino-4-deoxy-L-arabinose transferase-like glycosyltransferase
MLLVTQFLPWTLALAWSATQRARGLRWDASERFLHIWWLVVLGVFTLAAGKRPVYLLPAAPALALLAARALTAVDFSRWRLSLARLTIAIVIFDVGTLVTLQLMRESKARRRSLVAFTAKVAQIVPGTQSLSADPSIRASDRMVLAYRLRRPILREDGVATDRPYLVPAAARLGKWCAGRRCSRNR